MNNSLKKTIFDAIVVGGGHAGCEASLSLSRLGYNVLLITSAIDKIATMSCNPAIGGVGKGHLVKELDALGGEMAHVADKTGIHFKTLNTSRGPAVRATRCQSDMQKYQQMMTNIILQSNLLIRQDDVTGIICGDNKTCQGVKTKYSGDIYARKVILTTGTFMGGILHLGNKKSHGGRSGESPSLGLSDNLKTLGLQLGRLKTGTCPRLDQRTINKKNLVEQLPQNPPPLFSFDSKNAPLPQISCYITQTNKSSHDIIKKAINDNLVPIYNGQIAGAGPRYCPSIEDKVTKFPKKQSHHIFLEPQGLDTFEVYPSGISTSMPPDVQLQFLRTIEGLQEVEVSRWGYAVEYDFIQPTELFPSLQVKTIDNLYCAGQINGTTGYEEAAIQGLLAGLNVANSLKGEKPLILTRQQAYAGVLVDDLVTLGTNEPYRMFTSRAEHRLILREDNVCQRLMDISLKAGLLNSRRQQRMQLFKNNVAQEITRITNTTIKPSPQMNMLLKSLNSALISQPIKLATLLKRPEIDCGSFDLIDKVANVNSEPICDDNEARYSALVEVKYQGYIDRSNKIIAKENHLEKILIPQQIFKQRLPGLSNEVFEKLKNIKPQTLGQASRISGITPAAISLLAIEMQKQGVSCDG